MSRRKLEVRGTRAKLIEGAKAVFAEKGLDLTTIDDITERADVGKGTFYYHFKNKEKLVHELIRDLMNNLAEDIVKEVNNSKKLNRVLDRIIFAHIKFFSGRFEDYILYFQGCADLVLEKGYEGLESPFVEYIECIEDQIKTAIKRNVPKNTLHRIACAVAGFVSGYYSFTLLGKNSNQAENVMQSMRSALVAGLSKFTNEAVS
jgi:AcrR family transcriptional regulator